MCIHTIYNIIVYSTIVASATCIMRNIIITNILLLYYVLHFQMNTVSVTFTLPDNLYSLRRSCDRSVMLPVSIFLQMFVLSCFMMASRVFSTYFVCRINCGLCVCVWCV